MIVPRKTHATIAEIQLHQAAQFLSDPNRYVSELGPLDDPNEALSHTAVYVEMLKLESLAIHIGCESGFWRRLKKVADKRDRCRIKASIA